MASKYDLSDIARALENIATAIEYHGKATLEAAKIAAGKK